MREKQREENKKKVCIFLPNLCCSSGKIQFPKRTLLVISFQSSTKHHQSKRFTWGRERGYLPVLPHASDQDTKAQSQIDNQVGKQCRSGVFGGRPASKTATRGVIKVGQSR